MKCKIAFASYQELVRELTNLDSRDRLYYLACKRDRRRVIAYYLRQTRRRAIIDRITEMRRVGTPVNP